MSAFDPTRQLNALAEAQAVAASPPDLQKLLKSIAYELRTANLLAVAEQFHLYDVGGQSRQEALRRLGFTAPPQLIEPPK